MKRMTMLLLALAAPGVCSAAEYVCVAARTVNVRQGASVNDPVQFKAWRHTPLEIVIWGVEWAQVRDFEGDEGWVHRSLLSSDRCVIVTGKYANVREGADTAFPVAFRLEREYPLRVLERDGGWLKVTDDDQVEGWIYGRLVWGAKESGVLDPGAGV